MLFGAIVHAALALRSPSPWIVPDELIYSDLAKSMGDGGLPAVRDEVTFAYGLGYPLLLAPIWAVFGDVTTAYAAAKVLNAIVLSLTAVPAYFLARRFVAERSALLAAALSIAVPSMLYAGTLMTEVALYPAFVLALLAIAAALERPAVSTQLGALAAIGLAATIKMLAAVLVLAYVASIALFHWLDTRQAGHFGSRMRLYTPTWAALGGAGLVWCGVLIAWRMSPLDLLGAYSVVVANIDVLAVPWWALLHVAELDLYVAVIPFAATLGVIWRGVRRTAAPRERLFVALVVPSSLAVILAVSAFASTRYPGGSEYPENIARLGERNSFMLAPLFLIGLVLLFERQALSRNEIVVTAAVAAVLPALIPLDQFFEDPLPELTGLFPWIWINSKDVVAWPAAWLLLGALLAGLYVSRSRIVLAVAPIACVYAASTMLTYGGMASASTSTKSQGLGGAPDWIERAADGDSVSVLWSESGPGRFAPYDATQSPLWLGEFFNRNVGRVFELGTPLPFGLPSTAVILQGDRVVLEDGTPADLGEIVLAPCHIHVSGEEIARDPSTGARLVRVGRPIQAIVRAKGKCLGT